MKTRISLMGQCKSSWMVVDRVIWLRRRFELDFGAKKVPQLLGICSVNKMVQSNCHNLIGNQGRFFFCCAFLGFVFGNTGGKSLNIDDLFMLCF